MYITKSELENYLAVTIDASLDTFIAGLIDMAEDVIDNICGGGVVQRREFQDTADVDRTRYYDGNGATKLLIEDTRAFTSVEVDGVSLVENDDYIAYPLNEDAKEYIQLVQPSTRLNRNSRIQSQAPFVFDEGQRTVKIVGKVGYSVTPPALIKVQCMRLAGAVIKENVGDSDVKELTQESLGDYSASYAQLSQIANSLKVAEALASYIRKPIPKKVASTFQI